MRAPGRIVTATLYKTTKGFGFTLSGGDKTGQPVLIKSVKQGSPADTQGGLLVSGEGIVVNLYLEGAWTSFITQVVCGQNDY